MEPHRRVIRTTGIVAVSAATVALLAVGFGLFTSARSSAATATSLPPAAVQRSAPTTPTTASATADGTTSATITRNSPTLGATQGAISAPALLAQAVAPDPAPASTDRLGVYRGLGSWVDLYDAKAWAAPSATVSDMASHGVRTLFIETSNSRSPRSIMYPAQLQTFIRESHAHGMKVVAWFLPDMKSVDSDYSRISQAISFTTPDGQKFDSFSLDIESNAIASESVRNQALQTLTNRIRALVGPTYSLGAIIPSPVGLAKKAGYWNTFPYAAIARDYDVVLPMAYYTYHGNTASAAGADTLANMRILRAQPGCAEIPVHLIGGISDSSSTGEVRAFVRAARQSDCIGGSLYGWTGTSAPDWAELQPFAQ